MQFKSIANLLLIASLSTLFKKELRNNDHCFAFLNLSHLVVTAFPSRV
jgi:hypothetical protein